VGQDSNLAFSSKNQVVFFIVLFSIITHHVEGGHYLKAHSGNFIGKKTNRLSIEENL